VSGRWVLGKFKCPEIKDSYHPLRPRQRGTLLLFSLRLKKEVQNNLLNSYEGGYLARLRQTL